VFSVMARAWQWMGSLTGRRRTLNRSLCLLVGYAALLVYDLGMVPGINPDEAGYAEPAWTLLTRGEFGAPMFAGMFDMEHRIYTIWPGRGVMTVVPYLVFGPTLFAARIASVVMALLLALLSGIVVRRVLDRPLVGFDWLALVAVMTSPVVVNAGRFARPEIDVAAWSVAMIACLEVHRGGKPGIRRDLLALAGGMCAGLASTMHQYGLVSVGAGLLIVVSVRPSHPARQLRDAGLMVSGMAIAMVPWLAFILYDVREFQTQFGAAVANQAWRYPIGALMRALINELPGRFLFSRQDYPVDWDPWADASRLLVPTVSMTETWWALRLLVRIVRRPVELGPVILDRLWWMGVTFGAIGLWIVHAFRSMRASRVLSLQILALVWITALAIVPNKWLGYSVTPTVMVGLSAYCVIDAHPGLVRLSRRWVGVLISLTILLNTWVIGDMWMNAPRSRDTVVNELHDSVPVGARVLVPFREWYGFVDRNPAIAVDGRSLPMFGTSLVRSATEFAVEYVILVRNLYPLESRYYWIADDGFEWTEFLRTRTKLVKTIDGGQDGVIEVRKVVGDLTEMGVGAPLSLAQRDALNN
jgi:hypothetical protein